MISLPNLSLATSQRADSGASNAFGDIGGARFTFGGINTGTPWPWIFGIAGVALALWWLVFRNSK